MSIKPYQAVSPADKSKESIRRVAQLPARILAALLAKNAAAILAMGDRDGAFRLAMKAHRVCSQAWRPYAVLADSLFNGMDYLTVLSKLHDWLNPTRYLEIGVQTGRSMALAAPECVAVGIDPEPVISCTIRAKARLYPMTSDAFFEKFNPIEELGGSPELAFLDGLHTFEQLLKDFANTEKIASSDSTILMHDCLPIFRKTAQKHPFKGFWCGDVWKIVPCLRKYRPDLQIALIASPPSGLVIVRNLNPKSTVLHEQYQSIYEDINQMMLDYEHLIPGAVALQDALPATDTAIRTLLKSGTGSHDGLVNSSVS